MNKRLYFSYITYSEVCRKNMYSSIYQCIYIVYLWIYYEQKPPEEKQPKQFAIPVHLNKRLLNTELQFPLQDNLCKYKSWQTHVKMQQKLIILNISFSNNTLNYWGINFCFGGSGKENNLVDIVVFFCIIIN